MNLESDEKLNALRLKLKAMESELLYECECFEDMKLEKEKIESEDGFCDDENYNYERYDIIVMQMDDQVDELRRLNDERDNVLAEILKIIKKDNYHITVNDLKTAWLAT